MIEKTILNYFKKVDPILHEAALKINRPTVLKKSTDYFVSLCESIIGQQLSTKVGDVLCARFRSLFKDNIVRADVVVQMTPDDLRAIGTSNAKARYIIDLAQKVVRHEVKLDELDHLSNEEIIAELTKVKGIGPWTVEMFLMFTLGRPDVFSFGDLGLKRAIQKLYKMKKEPTIKQLKKLSEKWSPYRTYAAMVLWRSLE